VVTDEKEDRRELADRTDWAVVLFSSSSSSSKSLLLLQKLTTDSPMELLRMGVEAARLPPVRRRLDDGGRESDDIVELGGDVPKMVIFVDPINVSSDAEQELLRMGGPDRGIVVGALGAADDDDDEGPSEDLLRPRGNEGDELFVE
jgi:hypothetical protein